MTKIEELEKQKAEIEAKIERLKNSIGSDPIYLLSMEEYLRYKDKIPEWHDLWWLRTSGDYHDYVAFVESDGSVYYRGEYVDHDGFCIRPVLNEDNISEDDKWYFADVGNDRIVFCGVTWVRLDDGLWIAEMPIATRQFDAKSNNYAESDVRQFLLAWYEERKDW